MTNRPSLPTGFTAEKTLFFPLSGNPIGFNHFAAAEWLLRSDPDLERVLFILSNGRHPDPTKPDAEVSGADRLAICEAALAAVADPARSLLARRAEVAGQTLRLTPQRAALSTIEFGFGHAVRSAELVPRFQEAPEGGTGSASHPPAPKARLHWVAGTDLIRRMADPGIFSGEDLALLSTHCLYRVLEREGDPLAPALETLRETRGIALACEAFPLTGVPAWLAPFLALSSTLIREAVEAGDPIGGMLPLPAAEAIAAAGHYRTGRPAARLVALDGKDLGEKSQWALRMESLQEQVATAAGELHALLDARRLAQRPHALALVETTTGGMLTAALAGRAGASRFFRQSRFAYDAIAKTSLVGGELPGESAVSAEAVSALATAMRDASGADFALAESGMAGPPDGTRRSLKHGLCCFALAGPDGVATGELQLNPFLTRREHQLRFTLHALDMIRTALG